LAIAREVFRKTSLSIWLKPALPVLVVRKGVVLVETVVVTGVLGSGRICPHAKARCLHFWEIIGRRKLTVFSLMGLVMVMVGIH
jgi:hypothetical protein